LFKLDTTDFIDAKLMLYRQFLITPIRFIRSVILIPYIPPATIFLLKIITTWFGYVPRLNLGVNAIFAFYYPEAEAKNNDKEQNLYAYLAWKVALVTSIIGGAVGVLIAYNIDKLVLAPLLVIWGLSITPGLFIKSSLTAKGFFKTLAKVDVITALSNLIFPLIGWFCFGLAGYIIGSLISIGMIFIFGYAEIFPLKVHVPIGFVKEKVANGLNFWFNGFVSDLAKTYEVTLFLLLTGISSNFGGQYAVAMTLAMISSQLGVSISSVFGRKAVKQISLARNEGIYELRHYVIIDVLVFSIFFLVFIPASYIVEYLLPQYNLISEILPFLLLGVCYMRLRFYTGVVFKTDRDFLRIHFGHIIHLFVGIISLTILYEARCELYMLASSQILGAFCGTVFVSIFFFRKYRTYFKLKEFASTAFLMLYPLLLLIPTFFISVILVKLIALLFLVLLLILFVYIIDPQAIYILKKLFFFDNINSSSQ